MFKVSNRKAISNLALKSYKANRSRNYIAILAIVLTTILFTTLFTIGTGLIESIEESTMRMSGGYAHGSFKYLSQEQYERLSKHPLIKEVGLSIYAGEAVNEKLLKRYTEIDYCDETSAKLGFNLPTTGRLPKAQNGISTDTVTLDFLGVPHEIGQKVTLLCDFGDRKEEKEFILTGYYKGDPAFQAGIITVSKEFIEVNLAGRGQQYYKDHDSIGSCQAYVLFKNSRNIDANMVQVISDCGYKVDGNGENVIQYGVNWAYFSTTSEGDFSVWFAVLMGALLIVFTGYLIIYNIFQISVMQDIRFYGLLKTIGTTKKQIKRILLVQAMKMCSIGIPVGLVLGFLLGKILLPLILEGSYALVATVSINPVIFIGSAIFALFTVYISCRKPAKIASYISPVEAVKYNGVSSNINSGLNRIKKGTNGGKLYKMGFSNLGRNKKRTFITVVSISLSLVLLNTAYTMTESFDMDKYVSNFIDVDFQIAHAAYYKYKFSDETPVSKTMISAIEGQESFDRGGLIYNIPEIRIISKYDGNVEYEAGRMYLPDGSSVPIADVYAMDDFVMENLEIVKGSYDKEKFKTGKFLLLGLFADDNGNIMYDKALYQIGEKVKLKVFQHDLNINFDDAKEYEVMGYYRMRPTNCSRRYGSVAFAMPLEELRTYDNPVPMTYICNAKAGREDELEAFIKSYTESVEIQMLYNSRETYKKEFKDLQNMILSVGGVLCLIIGIIGILNFINSVFTSIITRRREFAMMESVGMTKRQLRKMLIYEGLYCGFYTIAISFLLTILFTFGVISQFSKVIWFMNYKFDIQPLLIAYPVLLVLSALIPYLAFIGVDKQSVVERLRIAE
jgi:putative ABC transport system permease protein